MCAAVFGVSVHIPLGAGARGPDRRRANPPKIAASTMDRPDTKSTPIPRLKVAVRIDTVA